MYRSWYDTVRHGISLLKQNCYWLLKNSLIFPKKIYKQNSLKLPIKYWEKNVWSHEANLNAFYSTVHLAKVLMFVTLRCSNLNIIIKRFRSISWFCWLVALTKLQNRERQVHGILNNIISLFVQNGMQPKQRNPSQTQHNRTCTYLPCENKIFGENCYNRRYISDQKLTAYTYIVNEI